MKRTEFAIIRKWKWMEALLGHRLTFNLYPPFLGAGIRVKHISRDFSTIDVQMRMRWFNRNYVGSHFGGSLYSMCDPFYMFILLRLLGPGYIVWDKAATIEFRRPGYGKVSATFSIPKERVESIRREVEERRKMDVLLETEVLDETGQVVALVKKTLYVRAPGPTSRSQSPSVGKDV